MVNRRISDDLKHVAMRLRARGDSTLSILNIVKFSARTFYATQHRYHLTGSVAKAQAIGRGRPRKAARGDIQYLLRLARHKPDLFLDEYRKLLERHRLLSLGLATIHREFIRAGLNIKRIQKMAAERDPTKRADFMRRIAHHPASCFVILDETSKDNRTYARLWGRSRVGARVETHQPFVRKRRFSLLASMALDEGIIAARVVEGSFTQELFLDYLRNDLVSQFDSPHFHEAVMSNKLPVTTPYPGPRSVLVMDNARIHHNDTITELVESYGCRIEYLPPYSPDYSPIEPAFSVIKAHLRRNGISFYQEQAAYFELYDACSCVTPEMTWGFFWHSGYYLG